MVDCGEPLVFDGGASGNLTSPNYPGNYPNHADCEWTISIPAGQRIGLNFREFHVEDHHSCLFDAVEVRKAEAAFLIIIFY